MKKLLPLLILPLLVQTGCKKDDEEKTPDPHKIVGTWQVIKEESRLSGQPWQLSNEPCRFDNVEDYQQANNNWIQYDGADQCAPGDGILRGKWRVAASDTKVIYTYDGIPGEYESTIEELTSTSLILTKSTGQLNGEQARTTYVRK